MRMWKNTIGFFHLSGRTDELIMPIAYQSIKGHVALDIVTHGPHMNLYELIARPRQQLWGCVQQGHP